MAGFVNHAGQGRAQQKADPGWLSPGSSRVYRAVSWPGLLWRLFLRATIRRYAGASFALTVKVVHAQMPTGVSRHNQTSYTFVLRGLQSLNHGGLPTRLT